MRKYKYIPNPKEIPESLLEYVSVIATELCLPMPDTSNYHAVRAFIMKHEDRYLDKRYCDIGFCDPQS